MRLNPLTKLAVMMLIVIAATLNSELAYSFYLLILAVALALGTKSWALAKGSLLVLPMAFGLGWFNALLAGSSTLGIVVFMRVYILAFSSSLLALKTDPYELGLSLVQQLRLPYVVAFTLVLAHSLLLEFLRYYRTILEAMRVRWLVGSELGGLLHLPSLTVGLLGAIGRRLETLVALLEVRGLALEARSYWRRVDLGTFDVLVLSAISIYLALPFLFHS